MSCSLHITGVLFSKCSLLCLLVLPILAWAKRTVLEIQGGTHLWRTWYDILSGTLMFQCNFIHCVIVLSLKLCCKSNFSARFISTVMQLCASQILEITVNQDVSGRVSTIVYFIYGTTMVTCCSIIFLIVFIWCLFFFTFSTNWLLLCFVHRERNWWFLPRTIQAGDCFG